MPVLELSLDTESRAASSRSAVAETLSDVQVSAALRILGHLDTVAPDYVGRLTGSLVRLFVVVQQDHKQHGAALAPIPGWVPSVRAKCMPGHQIKLAATVDNGPALPFAIVQQDHKAPRWRPSPDAHCISHCMQRGPYLLGL